MKCSRCSPPSLAGLTAALVKPRHMRDFVRGTGQLAKPGAIDARVLAGLADLVRLPVHPLAHAEARALDALVARR